MLSERQWSGEALALMMLGWIATVLMAKFLWAALTPLTAGLSGLDQKFLGMILGTISFQGVALIWVAVFLRNQKLSWSSAFGFRNSSATRAIALGLLAGILIVPVAFFFQQLTIALMNQLQFKAEAQQVVRTFQESANVVSATALVRQQILFGICVIVIAPVAEEILFRGLIYPTIKRLGRPKLALWGSSILFALLHSNIPSLVPFIVFALLLVYLYEKSDNLLAPIIAHSFFNTVNFIFLIYGDPIVRLTTPS